MKKFFRGKLFAKLALVAILANTLTSPVGVIAEEVTTDSSQEPKVGLNESSQTLEIGTLESSLEKVEEQPKIELQDIDTDGKDTLEADESFTANLKGTFSNLQDSSEKVITFKLNSDFVLDDEIKAPSEDIQIIKLSDDSFKVDFSQVEEAAKEFELSLPLTVKSTDEEAKLVLSSDHTQDVSKTFKVSQATIKTQQATSGQSSDEVDDESETVNSNYVDITEESKATETEKESKVETEKTKTTEKKEQSIVSKQAKSGETISVSGKITWEDGNDKYGWRPEEVKVFLYDRTQYKNVQEVTISSNEFGVWEFTFPDAPKLNPSGNLADYIISSNLDNKYQFTRENDNSYDYKASIKKSFSPMIRLLWLDNDNSQGKRPDSEEYHLLQNGKVCGTVTPKGQGSVWTATFERMPIFDDNFVPYKYEVQKKETTGYTTTYDYSNFNYDPTSDIETDTGILGIHIRKYIGSVQEFTTLSGTFTWDDANDKNVVRPGKVHARVYQNGELMDSVGISLPVDKNSNQGTYLVENLPKFDAKGNLYKYTLEVPGGVDFPYSQKVNGNNFEFTLHNSRRLSVSKYWYDNNNENNTRPTSVEVALYRVEDGKEILIGEVTITEGNGGQWKSNFGYVDEYDGNHNKYEYIVKEKVPHGYYCEVDDSGINWTTKNDPDIKLINTLGEEPTGSMKITKVDSSDASKKLAGATFKITNTETKAVWLAESNPTASNGELTITDIPVGKYELEEVKAPTGYDVSKEKISFEVTANNAATLQTFNFENTKSEEPLGKVKITKVDSAAVSTKLAGATFKITNKDTDKVWLAESNPTASNGELTITDIPVGKYVLSEVKAPNGYDLSKETIDFEVTAGNAPTLQTFDFENTKSEEPLGKVKITKVDSAAASTKLAGATFKITNADTDKVWLAESNPTASNGELTISNIPVGKYVLSEVKAPTGYDLSKETIDFEVTAGNASTLQTFNFENTKSEEPLGKVKITKVDSAAASTKLAGATFKITNADTDKVWLAESNPTSSNGELTISNIPVGKYVLSEVKAPTGYDLSKETIDFEVTAGNASTLQTFNFENTKSEEPLGKVKITKVDSAVASTKLAGATFKITNADTDKVWLAESNPTASNGELTISNIPVGKYVLSEVKAPTGYDVSKETIDFEVTAGNASTLQTFNFENTKSEEPLGKVKITKVDSAAASTKLAGATFKITNKDTDKVWLAESNPTSSNGELTISNIPVGKYVLSEVKAPNGYDLSKETIDFEVTAGNASTLQTFDFENTKSEEPLGKVKITKVDSAAASTKLAGATFKITNKDTNKVWLAESNPTASNGELTISNIPVGKYVLSEVKAPNDYDLSKETIDFEVTAGNAATLQTFNFENTKSEEPLGKVKITKVDSGAASTKLAGATFKITNADTDKVWLAESAPTASNGELTISNIPVGKYVLSEVKAPTGYDLSKETIDFEVTAGNAATLQTFNFENTKSEEPLGKVKITKVDSAAASTKLAGATFKITNADTDKVWLAESNPTASNGELTISNIPVGKYVLSEVKAPTGYDLSKETIDFEVTAGNASTLQTFNFENTKSEEPLGRVKITKVDSAAASTKLAGATFKITNKDTDKVWLAESNPTASNGELTISNIPVGKYVLSEVKAPNGYDLSKETIDFEVTVGNASTLQTFDFKNTKTPEPTGKVTIKKHETGDTDKALIADAEFTLTDSKGKEVKKTTKAGEELVFDNLAEGTYTLEETSSPAGYEKPDFKETFEVKDGVKLDFEYTVYNAKTPEPEKGKVTIKKYKDGDTTEALIADAEFTLYDADDKKISSQTTVEGKELVFDNLEYGKYTLKETKAPAGYEESTETKPVFEKEFEVTAADLNFEYKVANVPTPSRQTGKVSIKKYKDGDTTEALIGDAEFTLYDADGNEVAKKTTVKGEELVFDSLAYGKYTLKETKAPDGYEESTEANPLFEKEFEIAAGDLSFEYKVANKEIPEIQTSARDGETGTNEGYADEKVTIIDEVKYENLTIGKKYTVKGTLMDQATNQPFLTKDGKEVHAETSFDAEKTSGKVELTFEITNGDLQGKTVVVFEDLETEGKKVATHSDITDEKQSVDYPKVGTQASKSTKDDKITVTDIVSYEKLTVGKEYTVKGTLMDKETGKAFEVDGKAVTAETPFKPAAENGTTEVTFEFDKSAIEGKEISLVVFEKVLNADGKVIGTHEDLEDSAQTVEFKPDTPVIETSAKDSETGTNEGNADEKVTIIDTVTYKNLTIGKDYTVKGVLMDKATNQPFLTKDGKEVHAEKDFTADKSNGTIDLEFVITNGDLAGKTVVVFETLYREGVEVAVHADIEDKNQSVDYPKVGTKASKSFAGDTITVTDIVSYEKLTVGKEYTVKGTLMDKETGKAFEVDGKAVTAEAPFTPTEENGTTEVTFEFDRKAIEGKEISLVVFEKVLNADGKVIGTHEDLEDSEQTVEFNPDTPEISTTAKDSETGTNEGYADEKVSIIDTVHYDNLTIGKTYTVSGVLMDKATNQPFLTKECKEVRAEKEFVPDATNGSVDLEFVITNGDLVGKTVVVFETLYRDGKEVAAHTDIEDKDQSVDYPKVGTKASEKTVGDKIVVTDIVAYEKLTVGKKYTVNGTLMDKATGKAFEVDGKAVTAEATFTPETENGTTEVSFEFAQKAIEGKEISLVVFEKVLNADGKVIGTHEDLEDPDQTVSFNPDTPEISTKAKDKGTASNEGQAKKDVTIIDEVSYRNLIVGKEYTVKGVLMDKATNQPLLANGKEVRAEKTFTAKKPNGTIDLEFTFDGSALAGATVVVFETLYTDNKEVATHTDINDVDQTVTYPKVGTKASESTVDNTVVIKDIVSYENLVVGKKYTVKGVLMDKSTGLAYRVDGKKVLGETTFVAETASGTVEVAFEFAKSALTKKETLVVFEQLFNSKGYLVGTHEDINDKDQTVEVGDDTPGKPGLPSTNTKSGGRTYSYGTSTSRGSLPKTGSVTNPLFVILGLIIIGSAVTFYFVYIRRAKRNH